LANEYNIYFYPRWCSACWQRWHGGITWCHRKTET